MPLRKLIGPRGPRGGQAFAIVPRPRPGDRADDAVYGSAMPKPRIAIVFTGGTIAMRSDTGHGGNVPTLGGAALLETVPGLDAIADVVPIEWGLVPASHLTFAQVLDIGRVLERELARPDVAGAVVVQGTDVIDETAFAWDLLPLPPKPVVVVGAMRSASEAEPDGPENLRNAVAAAGDPDLAALGVVVAMAGEIHAADDVRKTHTHDLATFRSPNHGRLGTVERGRVTLERTRAPARLARIPERAALPVHAVTVALEADDGIVAALGDPLPAGLVVAGAGGGNTPPLFLALARRLIAAGVPVALTTRCPSGQARPGYAFEGGSSQWWDAGALFTGTLDALKARVLLALGIGSGTSVEDLAAICQTFGGGRA
jgi:L-asparaginase